uniref:DUF2931 family protein n=1 Tax=Ornithobacterium rhinotracheale TaxID=28251 RepID=UPI0039A5399F
MYAKIKLIITFFVLLQTMVGCKEKKQNKMKEEFSYTVTVSAPYSYVVEVHTGYLLNKNKEFICGIPRVGQVGSGWQYDGSSGGMGGSIIPCYLNLTYIAFAEKKVYTIDTVLPGDKILETFKEGYDYDSGKEGFIMLHETYDTLTIGIAPGGVIVVWLSGNKGRKEICRLQAQETEVINSVDFAKSMYWSIPEKEIATPKLLFDYVYRTLPDSVKTEIETKGIPYGLWDKYREKYTYRFVLNPYDGEDKVTFIRNLRFNGNLSQITKPDLTGYTIEDGIPYNCMVMFTKYHTEFFFNDNELFRIFTNFKRKYPKSVIDIVITPTFNYDDMKISIRCEGEEIKLEKYKVVGVWGG